MVDTEVKSTEIDGDRMLVVFDGHCGMCNGFVDSILKHPARNSFRFTPNQGEAFQEILAAHPELENADSIIVIPPGKPSTPLIRSAAVIAIGRRLGGWRGGLAAVMSVIPRPLRDFGYRIVARLRNKISRRRSTCRIPTPEEREFFLD